MFRKILEINNDTAFVLETESLKKYIIALDKIVQLKLFTDTYLLVFEISLV